MERGVRVEGGIFSNFIFGMRKAFIPDFIFISKKDFVAIKAWRFGFIFNIKSTFLFAQHLLFFVPLMIEGYFGNVSS